jgi:hypothetical protein
VSDFQDRKGMGAERKIGAAEKDEMHEMSLLVQTVRMTITVIMSVYPEEFYFSHIVIARNMIVCSVAYRVCRGCPGAAESCRS